MYFSRLDGRSGELIELELVALCRRRLRLERASGIDSQWLCRVLNAEGRRFGSGFELQPGSRFKLAGARHSARHGPRERARQRVARFDLLNTGAAAAGSSRRE